jgi:hypothetical protein
MQGFNRKIWLLVALTIVIGVQLIAVSEFYSISKEGFATNVSVVDISKQKYMYARITIVVVANTNVTYVVFANGTQVAVQPFQTYSFTFNLPRTGDIFGNAAASADGISVSQSQPIDATVLSNYSSTQASLDTSPLTGIPNIDVYLLTITGFADVTINGYGWAV